MTRASGLLLLCLCGAAAQEVRLDGAPLTNTFTPPAAGQPWGATGQLAATLPSWTAGLTYVQVPGVAHGGVLSFVPAEEAVAPRRGAKTLAPANTCDAQKDCIKVTIERADPSAACDGDCVWTACFELDLEQEGCVKSATDTISHTCVKDNDQCPASDFGEETQNPGHGHRQCQTGRGGETLDFLLKDGSGCGLASQAAYTDASLPAGSSVTCGGRQAGEWHCTGNRPGVECLWRVELPECGPEVTSGPPPPSSCPTAFYVAGYACPSDDACTEGVTGNLQALLIADGWTPVAPGPRFRLAETGEFAHATWAYGKVVGGELALPALEGAHPYVGVFHSVGCDDTLETGTGGGGGNPGPVNGVCLCPPGSRGFVPLPTTGGGGPQ